MNLLTISLSYLISRFRNSILNIIMLASGVMLITILLLSAYQVGQRLYADAKGIDTVIGAKGSPLQLVLSTIYHIDIPTGNISLKTANKIKKHPQIKQATAISLGDNYQNFRIIGTEPSYLKYFKASFASGRIWQNNMEVVIGYKTALSSNLKIGDSFFGSHGLAANGEMHEDKAYKIVGILKPTNSVLDRLIITSLESVWEIHEHHEEGEEHDEHHESEGHDEDEDEHDEEKEVTALLINYKSKIAALTLPRYINQNTNLQAANPAFEIARLIKLIGIGKDSVILFGGFLIFLSLASMLIALLNSVRQRRYDLAIFRTLGASRKKIFYIVLIEGMIISVIGSLTGLVFGHLAVELIGNYSIKGAELGLTGFIFLPQILILWGGILLLCLITCLMPAIRAYKIDIKEMLTHVT